MDLGFVVHFFLEYLLYSLIAGNKRVLTVPITMVVHKEEGAWEFFSGNYSTKIKITSLEEAIECDATVKEVEDLPPGHSAVRDHTDSKWIRYKM